MGRLAQAKEGLSLRSCLGLDFRPGVFRSAEHFMNRISYLNGAMVTGIALGTWWIPCQVQADAGPRVEVQHIEVTQSVQDDRNSVGLIAGKRTFVRVFVDY